MANPSSAGLASKIKAVGSIDLKKLDQLLSDGEWESAIHALIQIDAEAKSMSRACTSLANKVNKRHWNPLLNRQQEAA